MSAPSVVRQTLFSICAPPLERRATWPRAKTPAKAMATACAIWALAATSGLAQEGRFSERRMAQIFNAQIFGRPEPPADLDDDEGPPPPHMPRGADNLSASSAARIERLEKDLRSLTGQIEQLQYQMRKLEEQARAAPANPPANRIVEQTGRGAERHGENPPLANAGPNASPLPPLPTANSAPGRPAANDSGKLRRGDAFDPAQNPAAPGAPRQLGAAQPSAPLQNPPPQSPPQSSNTSLPPSVPPRQISITPPSPPPGAMKPLDINPMAGAPMAGAPITGAPMAGAPMANAPQPLPENGLAPPPPQTGPRADYEAALSLLKQGQYENAEKGFSDFLAKYPKSRLAADVTFQLGESYYLRNRQTEAAQQYLKITTDYAAAARAPEALLRLGQSLHAIGAQEQACASFAEISRKYPNASANIRAAGEREAKKAKC